MKRKSRIGMDEEGCQMKEYLKVLAESMRGDDRK